MMGGGWIMLQKACGTKINRRRLCHNHSGQANTGSQLGMQRLGNTCRAGHRVVLRRAIRLASDHRGTGGRYGAGRPRPGIAIVQLDQRGEEQQQLREDRHACQRSTDRRCQLAPHSGTHSR